MVAGRLIQDHNTIRKNGTKEKIMAFATIVVVRNISFKRTYNTGVNQPHLYLLLQPQQEGVIICHIYHLNLEIIHQKTKN